jgi:hypothetical protein
MRPSSTQPTPAPRHQLGLPEHHLGSAWKTQFSLTKVVAAKENDLLLVFPTCAKRNTRPQAIKRGKVVIAVYAAANASVSVSVGLVE